MGKANTHLRTLLCYQCTRWLRKRKHVNANVRVQDQTDRFFSASTNASAAGGTSQPHTKRAADTREPKPLSTDHDN